MAILKPPHWKITEERENKRDIVVVAEYTPPTTHCPACGYFLLDKHGKVKKLFMHTPSDGKRRGLSAH